MLRSLIRLILLMLIAGAACLGALLWWMHTPLKLAHDVVDFSIAPGSSLRAAVAQMRASGVALPELPFVALVRAQGKEATIKAGSYELAYGATAQDLLGKITRGDFAQSEIVFIEGWTFQQMREALAAHPYVRNDTRELSDPALMSKLGIDGKGPEGRFFPDTYRFPKNTSDIAILQAAYEAMERHLAAAWAQRDTKLPLASPYEALTLASIVEKETGKAEDRRLVAAVFVNRLRAGILLQTDPTVIYGMGKRFDGNLRKADLLLDTPYNTYTRVGLPPTPIAMPGLDSLEAVMHPADTDALYFVARGDGSSHFSRTLDDHNRAVTRYQKGGR